MTINLWVYRHTSGKTHVTSERWACLMEGGWTEEETMKPDWKDIREEYNWLAMDGDGYWFSWVDRPTWKEESKVWIGEDDFSPCQCEAGPDCSGIDWDFAYDTLEARPTS